MSDMVERAIIEEISGMKEPKTSTTMRVKSLGKYQAIELTNRAAVLFEESGVEISVGKDGFLTIRLPHAKNETENKGYQVITADQRHSFWRVLHPAMDR